MTSKVDGLAGPPDALAGGWATCYAAAMKQWLALVAMVGVAGVGLAAQTDETGFGNDVNGSMNAFDDASGDVETLTYDSDWSTGPDLMGLLDVRRASGTEPFIVQRSGLVSLRGFGMTPLPAIPEGWRQVHQVPAVEPVSGLRQYEVVFLSPHYAMVGSHPAWRVGGAMCMRFTGEARLYALGGESFPGEGERHQQFLDASTNTIRNVVLCTAAREAAPGQVSILDYGEDGLRHEPMEGAVITIEALSSIDAVRPVPEE
jgi:hypothetical protein